MKKIDLSGKSFGRLTVLREDGHFGNKIAWLCQCECGNRVRVVAPSLHRGYTSSCGCLATERRTAAKTIHGGYNSPTHRSWSHMLTRVRNPKHQQFKDYGGRGIQVCERWNSFENFLADMGERPAGKTLDRKNVNGNYEPSNCRWATWEEQANNKRKEK